jgi:endoglucanase
MHHLISVLWLFPATLSAVDLTNGSMTEGDSVPTEWSTVWTGDPAKPVSVHRDTIQFATAPAALRFENIEGVPFGNLSRPLLVTPEVEFQIGASLRIPLGTERATFAVQGYDAAGTQTWWQEVVSVSANQPETWVTKSIRATPPAGTARAVVILLVNGRGSAWLDDVTVGK